MGGPPPEILKRLEFISPLILSSCKVAERLWNRQRQGTVGRSSDSRGRRIRSKPVEHQEGLLKLILCVNEGESGRTGSHTRRRLLGDWPSRSS